MQDFSPNQWAILALVFVLGWLLGLLTLAGGRKWRGAFNEERAARVAAEAEADRRSARIAELEGERDRRLALEHERDSHVARAAATDDRVVQLDRGRPAVSPATPAPPAAAAEPSHRDDLARIFGVGRGGEIKLNELGIYRYGDIVALSPAEEAELESRMGLAPATIADERWREQAEMLRDGRLDEHARLFA